MTLQALPVSEKDISNHLGRAIHSPMYISNLKDLGIPTDTFLSFFSPLFAQLDWDPYDARRLQIEFLKTQFPNEASAIHHLFKDYFIGNIDLSALKSWTSSLSSVALQQFQTIQPWRRRSIAQFLLSRQDNEISVQRETVPQFEQAVADDDFRSWPRKFMETPTQHIDNQLFSQLLQATFQLVARYQPVIRQIRMVAHFMSVKATEQSPGDNSPEGAHEDGADFIVSALVVNRKNLIGGESQIIEQFEDGSREKIFTRELAPGEFIFQADTGEEKIYGNDLWHHVTPFHPANPRQGEGWRDIIGFDINILSTNPSKK